MKPNIVKITDFLKKQSGWIVAVVLSFFLFTCNYNHSSEIAQRDFENSRLEEQKIDLLKSIKKKNQIVEANKKVIANNNKKISSLQNYISNLEIKSKKQLAEMKNYSIQTWKQYYQDVTGYGDKDISVQDSSSLKITREPLVKIGNYLVKVEVTEAKYKLEVQTNNLLRDNINRITENYNQVVKEKEQLAEQSLLNEKIDQQIKDNMQKNIDDLKVDLKKASRPKLLPIILGGAAGFVAGSLLTK
jgi:hypothetical protein